MPDLRTEVTELATGLGTLGFSSLAAALAAEPGEMVSVAPETWARLRRAHEGGALAEAFAAAFANGEALLGAIDGLRGRRPVVVEWKGSHRAPGDEVAPIDLRIDHVFLVSCKYLSRITINASPFHLVERLLQGGHGGRSADWYAEVAPGEYQALYAAVRARLGADELPEHVGGLTPADRARLAAALRPGWPEGTEATRAGFVAAVAGATATRWQARAAATGAAEALFWRMLRMGSAPYFVLGASPRAPLRIRVATPWDWRQEFRLRALDLAPGSGGQPLVDWAALVEERHSGRCQEVRGHVEIRWSHGRFGGNPEAKVYLDTPHGEVPGYFALR